MPAHSALRRSKSGLTEPTSAEPTMAVPSAAAPTAIGAIRRRRDDAPDDDDDDDAPDEAWAAAAATRACSRTAMRARTTSALGALGMASRYLRYSRSASSPRPSLSQQKPTL